jgi:glutathione S-transferase
MKLYDFAFSPNCRKVRSVAYELGIEFEHVPVNLVKGEQRAPDFLAKNPNGRVPVLEDGDFVLWESVAILRYFAGKQSAGAPKLVPSGIREQVDMDRWLAWQGSHLSPAMAKVGFERIVKKLPGQGVPDQARIDEGTAEFVKLSAILDASLAGREYVAGPLSLADFALAAHYSLAGMSGLDLTPYARVSAWLSRVLARPSMRRALADAQAAVQ